MKLQPLQRLITSNKYLIKKLIRSVLPVNIIIKDLFLSF